MKVVIIDDDKSSGKALADLLETKYGMEVLGCALCGLDGLAMVNKCQPDVLLKPINPQELDVIVKRLEKEEEKTVEAAGKAVQDTLNGKLLFYTNSVDFKLVDRDDVCLFQYNHEVRCWEVVVAENRKPIRLKRNVKSTDLLSLDPHFLQVNQKFIVNINYLIEVVDNVCHFYPPFDEIDYVKVGRLYRKKLIDRFLSI